MNQAVLVAILQMLLGFLEVGSYALLVFWAFKTFRALPLKKHFRKVRSYHLLIPSLALAGLAYMPIQVIWRLIRSFPLDFSKAWIPPLLRFVEGVGFLGLIIFLCFFSGKREEVERVERGKKVEREKKVGRTWIWVIALVVILAILGGVYYYLSSQGYIVRFSLFKPEYLEYHHESPKFSFSYPSRFVIDKDKENRFGESYLVGIKLPSDNRVGCDVRAVKGKLNLSGDLKDVTNKLAKQISEGAEGFEVLDSSFTGIDGEEAIKLEIKFKGPLGETMRTDQIFTAHKDRVYTLICGTTKDTYEFFAGDFAYFFENFSWE